MTDSTKDKYYVYNEDTIVKTGRTGTLESPFIIFAYYDEADQSYIENTYIDDAGYYAGNRGRVICYCSDDYVTDFNYLSQYGNEPGRDNTEYLMSVERNVTVGGITSYTRAYVQGPQPLTRGSELYAETIWYVCDEFNKGTYSRLENNTGCDDWYIPSKQEASFFQWEYLSSDADLFSALTSSESRRSLSWTCGIQYDRAAICISDNGEAPLVALDGVGSDEDHILPYSGASNSDLSLILMRSF